jgi:hypothetical protein
MTIIDLSKGPMVLKFSTSLIQSTICGSSGSLTPEIRAQTGEQAQILIVPPGYKGPLPEGGFYIGHSGTVRAYLTFIHDK